MLVVIGHAVTRAGFGQWIYAFHMPLFFFISGYLYSLKVQRYQPWLTIMRGVKSQIYRLLLPFFFWNLLVWGISFLYAYFINKDDMPVVIENIMKLPFGGGAKGLMIRGISVFPSWFLTALFLSNIALTVVCNLRIKYLKWIIWCAMTILGVGIFIIGANFPTPYHCEITCVCVPFVVVGLYYNKIKDGWRNPISALVLIMVGTFFNVLNLSTGITTVEMVNTEIGNPIYFYMSALPLCVGVCTLFETLLKESSLGEYFGRNSMTIMFLHYPIICLVRNTTNLDILSQLAIICVILFIACEFVNRYIPWSMNFKLLRK